MGRILFVALVVVCGAAAGWLLRGAADDPGAPGPPPIDTGAKVAPPRNPDLDASGGGAGVSGSTGAPQLRGAQLHSLWYDSSLADMERELDLVKDAGGDTVRIDLAWSSLETNAKGDFSSWYVNKADAFMAAAGERGLKVIGTLWATPCWASAAPEEKKLGCTGAWWDRGVDRYAPANPSDYADAAVWVARRWGAQLVALEVWNEPNLPDKYSLQAPDPAAAYAGILKAAYPRVKEAVPGLRVIGGALAFSDGDFLERLYDLGIKGHFDAFSIHPYNEWRDPDDLWKIEWRKYTFLTGVPWVRSVMEAHGDGDKSIWLTEFGFSTCGTGSSWCVAPQAQSEFINDSFRIAAGWDYVEAAIAYNLRNKGTDPEDRESQFGLVARDFTPKPGYEGFKAAMAREAVPGSTATADSGATDGTGGATAGTGGATAAGDGGSAGEPAGGGSPAGSGDAGTGGDTSGGSAEPQPEPSPGIVDNPAPVPFGVTVGRVVRGPSYLDVRLVCAGPCRGTVVASRARKRLGSAAFRARSRRALRVRVRLTKAGRAALRRGATPRVAVAVRADAGGGARATIASRSFVLR